MLSSGVLQELSRKADDWRVSSLESELSRVRGESEELSRRIGQLESYTQTLRSTIGNLMELLSVSGALDEQMNELHQLKVYL